MLQTYKVRLFEVPRMRGVKVEATEVVGFAVEAPTLDVARGAIKKRLITLGYPLDSLRALNSSADASAPGFVAYVLEKAATLPPHV